jgi:hypothetical protein
MVGLSFSLGDQLSVVFSSYSGAGIAAAVLADKYLKTYAEDEWDVTQKTVVYDAGEYGYLRMRKPHFRCFRGGDTDNLLLLPVIFVQ